MQRSGRTERSEYADQPQRQAKTAVKQRLLRKPDPTLSDREFYLRSFTLGLPVNLGGALVAVLLLISGHRPERFGNCINFTVGRNWGGGSAGVFMFTCQKASRRLKEHEHGHSIQNCFYGPLMPFVNLQSSIRYLYRFVIQKLFPQKKLPPYDSAWFEGEATALGRTFMLNRITE
ncbi:MAG: hypothetical protein K6C08_09425 [Oscillospiraceae bacterium]|nr:hypothetical protein [Oscillospiraceae bacterium]